MDNLEDIHEALSRIDDAIAQIERYKSWHKEKLIEVEQLDRLCVAVNYVLEWDRSAYTEAPYILGITAPTLQKFLRFKGKVRFHDAAMVAQRLRTYVRSLDQASATSAPQITPQSPSAAEERFSVTGTTWVAVEHVGGVKQKIALISSALDSIVMQVRSSNLPPEEQLLSEIERHQLIAVLETALAVLKAPLVEKGLLVRTKEDLQKAAKDATEKQVQQGVGELASYAATLIKALLKSLFD